MVTAEFEWLTLDEGEEVEWSGQPHEYSLIPALVVGIPLAVILVGLVIVVAAYLSRENTDYVITTDALYVKKGVLSRDVQRIGFEKVQDTSYSQDFFGTQFGYGHVEISTAGGSGVEMRFRSVPDPQSVQERVNRHIRESGGGGADREDKAAVLDDILTELRAIRRAVESETGSRTPVSDGHQVTDSRRGEPGDPTDSTDG